MNNMSQIESFVGKKRISHAAAITRFPLPENKRKEVSPSIRYGAEMEENRDAR